MWPYSKSVVPDCVEGRHLQVVQRARTGRLQRLRRGSLTRSHDDTRRNFREDGRVL